MPSPKTKSAKPTSTNNNFTKRVRRPGPSKFEKSPHFKKLKEKLDSGGLGLFEEFPLDYSPSFKVKWGMTAKDAMRHQKRSVIKYLKSRGLFPKYAVHRFMTVEGLPEGYSRIAVRYEKADSPRKTA